MAPPSLRNFHKVRQRPPQPLWRSLFSQKKIIKTYLCLQKLSTRSVSSNFHTEFEINPLESDFYCPTPSPLEFPGPLTPSPPPLTPRNFQFRGGGMDIFSNHTLYFFKSACYYCNEPCITKFSLHELHV